MQTVRIDTLEFDNFVGFVKDKQFITERYCIPCGGDFVGQVL